MTEQSDTTDVLAAWWAELTDALGLGAVPIEPDALLSLAGVAAHSVVRPAAPLTTFLVGYAAGLAGGGAAELASAVDTAAAAAAAHAHSSD